MREGGRVWVVGYDVVLEECDLIVMRDAGNEFGPVGCEHISAALRELTGLHKLALGSTCQHDCGCCGACDVTLGLPNYIASRYKERNHVTNEKDKR